MARRDSTIKLFFRVTNASLGEVDQQTIGTLWYEEAVPREHKHCNDRKHINSSIADRKI